MGETAVRKIAERSTSTGSDAVTYSLKQIPLNRIRAFAFQPRKWFDPREIRARAESMKAMGQQDPVTVEPLTGDPAHDYELINGESRLRSAQKAGIKTLWAAVRSRPFESRTAKHMASLVANFNRSDHTPMEISDALHIQVTEGGKSQGEIARAIGKTDFWVCSYLSLQKLHPDIRALLHPTTHKDKRIAATIGFVLAKLEPDQQLKVMKSARGSDGRITMLRVKIEAEIIGLKKGKSRMTPSKRREKIVNTMRALNLDVAKLKSIVDSDRGEAAKELAKSDVLKDGIETLQTVKAAIETEWTPERMASAQKHRDQPDDVVKDLRAGIAEFRRMLEERYQNMAARARTR
jgi:ParB/RepB/Spo0J family partition protein